MFGGTFDPNYFVTIHALPSQVQPTTNKRNAALIQKYLEESLRVRPSHGFTRFVATAPENMSHGGTTLAGELEEANRLSALKVSDEFVGMKRTRSKAHIGMSSARFGCPPICAVGGR